MSIDTLEPTVHRSMVGQPALDEQPPALDPHDTPLCPLLRPALLAGEECEAPDPWIFRGTD